MNRAALVFLGVVLVACSSGPAGPSGTLTVTSITPTNGTTFGGTTVTVRGSRFAAGATVTLGGVPATGVTLVDEATLSAVTGVHAAGTVDVVVTSGGRSATLRNAFTYVAPSGGTNQAPTIASITARGTRPNQPEQFADLNEEIAVTAVVTDPDTPSSSLVYEWSAANQLGAFTGSGASVRWRAPQTFATPGAILLSLTVIERYSVPDTNGLPLPREHRVSAGVSVRVHDSAAEVSAMARNFLLLFSDSTVAPETVVQDFLPGCGVGGKGRETELADVEKNREEWFIHEYSVGQPQVTIGFRGICPFRLREGDACAQVAVRWTSTSRKTGEQVTVAGTDQVTAIYNGTRWGLCDSDFDGSVVSATGLTRPGSAFKR